MLILTRKVGESIRIGDDIEVVVTEVNSGKVKIGIQSPARIPIYREEVYRRIQEQNREAATMDTGDLTALIDVCSK